MKHEEIIGMIHRVMGLTRRGPQSAGEVPPPPPGGCPGHGEGRCAPGTISFRERGRLLIFLEKEDGITQKQLAEKVSIRPQSLSELLYKLEVDGMIVRKPHEADKRACLVYLTDHAREHLGAIKAERKRFAAEFLSPLTEEEQEQLAAILKKLIDAKTEPEK